ncbi:hypothetical protein P9112_001906 [Eukaryota sp. TZLM1-RC]
MTLFICGCYERSLLGMKFSNDSLTNVFQHVTHLDSVKSISCGSKFFASGSSDEIIHVFDVKKLREVTSLFSHSSTVSSLAFTDKDSFLVSGDRDGCLILTRTSDWSFIKQIKLDGGIASISMHPSGSFCVVLTDKKEFHLVDLKKFTITSTQPLSGIPISSKFSPSGSQLVITTMEDVILVDLDSSVQRRIGLRGSAKELEIVGKDIFISLNQKLIKCSLKDFENLLNSQSIEFEQRIRGISIVKNNNNNYIGIAGAQGKVSIMTTNLEPVCSEDLSCRLTCCTSKF